MIRSDYEAKTVEDLDLIALDLIKHYPNGTTVLLIGTLASGKSTLVGVVAKKLGIETTASPTFGVMHEYAPNFRHYDLYRIGSEEFFAKGLHETIDNGWNMIEWSDKKIENYLTEYGIPYIKIEIEIVDNRRILKVSNAE